MKTLGCILVLLFTTTGLTFSQTIEELKAQKAEKEAQVGGLQGEISDLQAQIDAFPGWNLGTFGTLGFNLSSFDNWRKQQYPNSVASTIRASLNGFANYDDDKQIWKNSANINLAWQKLDLDKDFDEPDEVNDFESIADVFRITSLYGYKVTPKLAISALGEFNTSIINNFNDPGILDLGVGATWLPIPNMVVVVHPLNYHWVFGDNPDFESALGAKFVVDYGKEIIPGINWKSNLTGFLPYQSFDPGLGEITWTNGLSFTVWKGIGVGFDFGIRKAEVESPDTQSYWVLGLSYSL